MVDTEAVSYTHLDVYKRQFGDSANDIDMIQYVKYGTAMGNSVPELLEIAPYKTARADEDGIEKGLKKFGLI